MNYLLYNEFADGGKGKEDSTPISEALKGFYPQLEVLSTQNVDKEKFFAERKKEDTVIVIGGDGTINYLINHMGEKEPVCKVYLYPSGTGNDFLNDVKESQDPKTKLIPLNGFIHNLPTVEVKGKKYRFINGIGYGIDGECCVEAERLKKEGKADINYSSITIGLLFGSFKPRTATVKVDGKEIVLKKAYLASAMNGRYYGGGMMIAPDQKRGSGLLTCVVIHGHGKLGTFMMFPGLFKGKHKNNKKHAYIVTGKTIEVSFNSPCGLQIDGDIVEGVTSYKATIA